MIFNFTMNKVYLQTLHISLYQLWILKI